MPDNITINDMDVKQYTVNIPESFLRFADRIKTNPVIPLHSMHVVGSVLTPDFNPAVSDINSIIIAKENQPAFLDFLIELGREFRGVGVAPPLVMTKEYIEDSLDVFPIEFFNFRIIHHPLFGEDILSTLHITDHDLRLQCEREIKVKLLWLGQIYIEALGDRKVVLEKMVESITGYLPLFRAVLHLAGREVPLGRNELLPLLQETIDLDTAIFKRLFQLKAEPEPLPDKKELQSCFTDYSQATEHLARYVDQLSC